MRIFCHLVLTFLLVTFTNCQRNRLTLNNSFDLQTVKINLEEDNQFDFTLVRILPISNRIEKFAKSPEQRDSFLFISKIGFAQILEDRVYLREERQGSLGNVYIFNNFGELIWKSKKGKGPGEIMSANKISVNVENGDIYILDGGMIIHQFSKDGVLVKKTQLPFWVNEFANISKDVDLFVSDINSKMPFKVYRLINEKSEPFPLMHRIKDGAIEMGEILNFQNFRDSILFSYYLTDTIYSIVPQGITPFLKIDFSPKGIGSLSKKEIESAKSMGSLFRENKLSFKSGWFCVVGDYLYCHASNDQFRYICKVNYKKDESKVKKLSDVNLFGISFPLFHFVGYSNEGLIFSIDAEQLGLAANKGLLDSQSIDPILLKKLKGLTEMDNPVLAIVK